MLHKNSLAMHFNNTTFLTTCPRSKCAGLAMRFGEDFLVLSNVRNNENFRHAAYRQYVSWQHGRLGRGNRRVVPSCCVVAIHACYPSPNGMHTGYRPIVVMTNISQLWCCTFIFVFIHSVNSQDYHCITIQLFLFSV